MAGRRLTRRVRSIPTDHSRRRGSALLWAMRSLSAGLTGSLSRKARLRHRRVRVVGREHDPFHADLKHQVEERLHPVEAAERVVEVLAEVGADRALQLRHLYGQSHLEPGHEERKSLTHV